MFNLYSSLLLIIGLIRIVFSISCYKCSSINGSNPLCDDFFQGDLDTKTSLLQNPCLTNLRGRKGLFPATHCVKLTALSRDPIPIQYTYRTCSRDEGEDNGITRASHCGYIKLDWIDPHERLRGCLHICDKDACNQSRQETFSNSLIIILLIFVVLFFCLE